MSYPNTNLGSNDTHKTIISKILQILNEFKNVLNLLISGLAIKVNVVPAATDQWTTYADVTVTTPGTAQQFANVPCTNGVLLSADDDNTGAFYIGDATLNTTGGRHGTLITASGTREIKTITNLNQLWFDADNNSDVLYIQRL